MNNSNQNNSNQNNSNQNNLNSSHTELKNGTSSQAPTGIQLRPYQASDLESLYEICLKTGDSGKDASSLYHDPKLLGHYYAAPYGVIEAESCFMLEDALGVCGYIVGTPDSKWLEERLEKYWFPALRQQYAFPDPQNTARDQAIIDLIFTGYRVDPTLLEQYPAHLHIDLLPRAQGKGWGRRLMRTFWWYLQELEVPGLHLGVSAKNLEGIAFYRKLGFELLQDHSSWQVYGKLLEPDH
jgi:ribosomal protein S18 acetylase RimI-like enzyme